VVVSKGALTEDYLLECTCNVMYNYSIVKDAAKAVRDREFAHDEAVGKLEFSNQWVIVFFCIVLISGGCIAHKRRRSALFLRTSRERCKGYRQRSAIWVFLPCIFAISTNAGFSGTVHRATSMLQKF